MLVTSMLSSVTLFFMVYLQKILRRESDSRVAILKLTIDNLISSPEPSAEIVRAFPKVAEKWKEMRANLDKMKFEIEESSKEKALALVARNMAHDLRAPLGAFERLLVCSDEEIPNMKLPVKNSLNRMYAMIESLRHGEIDNLIKSHKSEFDFGFGKETLEANARRKNIRFFVPSESFRGIVLDHAKVERAWINLASNAIEFARSLVKIESELQGTSLFIRVIDDGPGVPDEFLPRLFQRGATHGKHDGTGLGLAYVRQIMRGHGGDVTYRRENGLTIFECYLPNAVVINQEDTVQSQSAPDVVKEVKVKRVGICFVPKSLADSLCAELASHDSVKFSFSTEYEGADIVATNDPDLALTAIEEGKLPLEFRPKLSESVVLDMLKRRFDLV